MDEIFQKAVERNVRMRKQSVPWKTDEPYAQSWYAFDSAKQTWEEVSAKQRRPNDDPGSLGGNGSGITKLALFAWNIDFMLPFARSRMDAALAHLEVLTSRLPPTTAAVVFLQECTVPDLAAVGEKAWVRDGFAVTDVVDSANWASGFYGTTTLVDRRLPVAACFRVHYARTDMERDGLFVDVLAGERGDKTVRLCNTHLESLAREPPFRPAQVRVAAGYMHEEGVHGALAAGDFNAIEEFDRTLHGDNGLRDAYLELGGEEDSDAGYTWGQQAATQLRERFGCSRMDKIYFRGGLELRGFERFGADLQVSDESERAEITGLGFEKPWITDHMGVKGEFSVVG